MGFRRFALAFAPAFVAAFAFASGCGAPSVDYGTALGKRWAIDQANGSLSSSNCKAAYDVIYPVYNSASTDNEVRQLMAATYACFSGLSFFTLLGDIALSGGTLAGAGGLFTLMTLEFPSSTASSDKVVESASLSIAAAQSAILSGTPVLSANQVNAGSYNVGSTVAADRVDDANAMIFFSSWAVVGGDNNRYGAPNGLGHPTAALAATAPFNRAKGNQTDAVSCEYASALVNFADTLQGVLGSVTGPAAANLSVLANYATAIYAACDEGCRGTAAYGTASTCALSACASCPNALRKKNGCASPAVVTDAASCAAGGLMNFVASHPVFKWQ